MNLNGEDNPGRLEGEWRAFALGTKLDRVRQLFKYRYGYAPDRVVRAGPILLAGPIRVTGTARVRQVKRTA